MEKEIEGEEKYKSVEHEVRLIQIFKLHDIKQEVIADTYQMKIVEKQLNTINVSLKKNEIIDKEISSFDDQTKLFDKVGRV